MPPPRLGLKEVTFNIRTEFALIKNNIARCQNNFPYIFTATAKPKRRCTVVKENSDEKLKNDVRNCLTRLVVLVMFQKKLKGKKKIKLQKKTKKKTTKKKNPKK